MKIPFRTKDGGRGEAPNVGELRRRVESGEVAPDAEVFDQLRGLWVRADRHPMTWMLFPGGVSPEASALDPAAAPRPTQRHSGPASRGPAATAPPRAYWKLGFVPAVFLLGGIAYRLAGPRLSHGASALLDVSGTAVALGTLLAVSIVGLVGAFSGGARRLALGAASLVPLVALGVFVFLLLPGAGRPAPASGTAASQDRRLERQPLVGPPAKSEPPARPAPSAPSLDQEKAYADFNASLNLEASAFDAAVTAEGLPEACAAVTIRDVSSIRTCRAKLARISALMDGFIRKVESAFDLFALQVEAPLSGKARQETDLEFRIAKEMALSDVKDFFKAAKQYNAEADRMLSFMEDLAQAGSPSNADVLTLQLYKSRLGDTGARLDEMSKDLDSRIARAQVNMRERLSRSASPRM
jgi:hypothetical protein